MGDRYYKKSGSVLFKLSIDYELRVTEMLTARFVTKVYDVFAGCEPSYYSQTNVLIK